VKENGFPPTLHEIKDEFGYSSANSSHQHLRLIARKGYISLPGGKKSRGIKLLRSVKK
jgi:SOS-response transcriptional repressor LexA